MRNTRSRKGIASTVATVLMFFILFTVGTGYFIFVNGLNSQYSSNLQTAQRNLSGGLGESLKVTAVLLSSTGDLGFYVNNTASGSGSGNVTIAMVISPTGAVLKCVGKSLTAGACASQSATFTLCSNASCSTTTSPSPNSLGVKAGKGSAVIDTGYVYPTGTTDTVRVVTNFGNAFAATYPTALTSQSSVSANTAQSLTINPSTFKWTTIQPSTSSVHQSNFASNCNSASCGAAYTSSVTVGNTLVYALGWSGQSPPSTPTDTRGSTFTLGVSNSASIPVTPTLVQNQYASNCSSQNCALAYTNPVTSGNVLVFGIGWYNQSPPTTPTDTRGDTYVLGASQSVVYNPPSPSVVQSKYLANCNSANCQLGYTSSVTAGNTLVYGLGWYGGVGNTYVPVTLTNSQAAATPNPFQQQVTWNPSTYSAYEASNLGNIRFCADTACATTLNAWLESCTASCTTSATSATAWVKLTSAITGSGGTLTIYMVFQSTGTTFDGNYWGEAPSLSGTYGQYDNGANLFGNYQNFAGSSLPSGWSSSTTASVNNHLTITAGAVYTTSTAFSSLNTVEEMYAEYTSLNSGNYAGITQSSSQAPAGGNGGSAGEILWMTQNGGNALTAWSGDGTAASYNLQSSVGSGFTPTLNTFYVIGTYVSSTQVGESVNYGATSLTVSGTFTKSQYIILGYFTGSSAGTTSINPETINWVRTRALPPSAVMPSVSLGGVTAGGNSPPSGPTDTLGDTYTLGASKSVTPGVTPSVVQKNYASNCNSANCLLAYTSNVAAGNTLVFGLGWYGTLSYVPITLTNNQGSATPTTFQQKVTWNPSTYSTYEASNLGNIRFCADTGCTTTYNSWLESCTPSCTTSATSASAWVKLTSAITGSGGTKTIYMAFQATSVDFDTNYWGEAPNLSGTYGAKDNGASVFNFYDNFAGSTLSNKWTTVKSAGGSVSVNNGATFTTAAGSDYAFVDSATQAYPQVAESYMVSRGGTTDPILGVSTSSSANNHQALYNGYSVELLRFSGTDYLVIYAQTSSGATLGPYNTGTPFNAGIWQVIWSATGSESASDGSINQSTTDATATIGNYGIYLGQTSNSAGSDVANWGRMRAYPPSNVMPSTSFGGVTGGITPSSVTDTLGSSFTLGASNTVTSGTNTYLSYIWYATSAASGADTITAAFSASVTGSVSIYELNGITTTGATTSVGGSSAGSTAIAVTSFTPASNSIVIGNAETGSSTSAFTAGSGYALSGTCAVVYGCGESKTGVGSATTVPFSIVASSPWVEAAISFAPASNTYNSYIWYATAISSGADTITATFSSSVTGSVSIYELVGISTASPSTSTGSSSTGTTTSSVTSFTPASNSIVIGNSESASGSSTFTAGTGLTLSGACTAVFGCGESQTGVGSATTVPFTISASTPWAESAISFPPAPSVTYYSYVWYATAASSGADTVTAAFTSSVAGAVSIYEFTNLSTTGVLSSTGSSSTSQSSSSVASFTPATSSVVVGNTEAASTTFTAGSGFTLGGACAPVNGCGEYQVAAGSATTVPMSFSSSGAWVEAAVAFVPVANMYYSYIWYAPAGSTGADTITATFGSTVAGSVSIYELVEVWTTGTVTSTGNSPAGSTGAAVASLTPGGSSIVIGMIETTSTTFTAGSGYTLGGTCSSVKGCSEYKTLVGSATTVPASLGPSAPWVEAAIAFPGAPVLQSGQQVGGYPAMSLPLTKYLSWQVQFTNQDARGRGVTLWPKSLAGIQSLIAEDVEITPFFIVDGVSLDGTTLIAYNTTQSFVSIPYKATVTVYFGSMTPKSTTPDRFDTANEIAPFTGFFALEGIYSDKTLFGLTVPYPAGMVNQGNANSSPTAGGNGVTVTASCNNPCNFIANARAYVGWMDSAGRLTTVKTFTMSGSGNIPSGVTFQVPTAPIGFYTLIVSDYVNTVFMTFQHT